MVVVAELFFSTAIVSVVTSDMAWEPSLLLQSWVWSWRNLVLSQLRGFKKKTKTALLHWCRGYIWENEDEWLLNGPVPNLACKNSEGKLQALQPGDANASIGAGVLKVSLLKGHFEGAILGITTFIINSNTFLHAS